MVGSINNSIWANSTLREAGMAYKKVKDCFLVLIEFNSL